MAKKDYNLIIETEGAAGISDGVGFVFTGTLKDGTNYFTGEQEFFNDIYALAEKYADTVFDRDTGFEKIEEMVAEAGKICKKYGHALHSIDGTPAVQVETLEGRRLEIDIPAPGAHPLISDASYTVRHERKIRNPGMVAISPNYGNRHFYFSEPVKPGQPAQPGILGGLADSRPANAAEYLASKALIDNDTHELKPRNWLSRKFFEETKFGRKILARLEKTKSQVDHITRETHDPRKPKP